MQKQLLLDMEKILTQYLAKEIDIKFAARELETKMLIAKKHLPDTFVKQWYTHWENIEISSAEIALGEIPSEDIISFADNEAQILQDVISNYLENLG